MTIASLPCRLLLVTNTLARGGAEAMLVRLAHALDPARVQPVVVCLKEPGVWSASLIERGIPLHSALLEHKYDLRVLPRLVRLLRHYRPACIMAVGSGGDRMFWSTLAARAAGAPTIVWSHLFPVPGEPEFEWINRRLYRWVDTFVALGRRHAEALTQAAGVPARRVHVIRNGIDVEAMDLPEQREPVRAALGLQPDHVAIGLVANLRPIKRVSLFVEAAARVRAARPQTRFVVVGDGPQREELEALIARCADLQTSIVSHAVRDAWCGTGVSPADAGRLARHENHDAELATDHTGIQLLGPREDVPELMQALDVVCLTSERECLSVAMLEAMAAGKAFVAPRIGSLDEALIDRQTGRFFDPPTAESLAAMLIELVDDPAERARLGQAARNKVCSEFGLEPMARAFETLVCDLCTRTA